MTVAQIQAHTASVPKEVSGPSAGWTAAYPHDELLTPCVEVAEFDTDDLRALAERLVETRALRNGLAVAANQVGDNRRVFSWAWDNNDGFMTEYVIVNPTLSSHDGSHVEDEGCLSMNGIFCQVERAERVTIDGFNVAGEPFHAEADGLLAVIFQHEVDHLDGVMFIDHLNRQQRRNALRHWDKRRKQLGLD